jgi:hypothetical protein
MRPAAGGVKIALPRRFMRKEYEERRGNLTKEIRKAMEKRMIAADSGMQETWTHRERSAT